MQLPRQLPRHCLRCLRAATELVLAMLPSRACLLLGLGQMLPCNGGSLASWQSSGNNMRLISCVWSATRPQVSPSTLIDCMQAFARNRHPAGVWTMWSTGHSYRQ